MSYVGNTPTQQAFTPAVDFFNGNGSTTAFTLSRPVASVAQVQAVISNVPQKPGDAYTVSGNTITFTSAPPSGTQNIYVYYTSPITQVIAPGQGTVGTAQIQNGAVIPADLSTGAPAWDANGNMALNGVTPSATGGTYNSLQVKAANITSDGLASIFYNNAYYDGTNERYVATGAAQKLVLNNAANGSYVLNIAPSGTAGSVITWTNVMQVNRDATLALQGGSSSSGTGIAFPATQSASTNANTLDDYEEGSWTPTDVSGAGLSFPSVNGYYTKIGNLVSIQMWVQFPVTANGTGCSLGGLPFGFASGSNRYSTSIFWTDSNLTMTAAVGGSPGGTGIQPRTLTNATIANSSLSNRFLICSLSYMTS